MHFTRTQAAFPALSLRAALCFAQVFCACYLFCLVSFLDAVPLHLLSPRTNPKRKKRRILGTILTQKPVSLAGLILEGLRAAYGRSNLST